MSLTLTFAQGAVSPLQQYMQGILGQDVKCQGNLVLVFKAENMHPACLSQDSVLKLVARGWAKPMQTQNETTKIIPRNDTKTSTMIKEDNQKPNLQLTLSTDSSIIQSGQAIGIKITVNNTSSNPILVPVQNNWSFGDVSTGSCARIGYGMAVFDGYYTADNLTQGRGLQVFKPGVNCPVMSERVKTYQFNPSSGEVMEIECNQTQGTKCNPNSYQMGYNYRFSGYWNQGNIIPFKPGIYTILGADEWGHVATKYFIVTNGTIFAAQLGAVPCPLGLGFTTIIKNSTGFAGNFSNDNIFVLHKKMHGTIDLQYNAPSNAVWFTQNDNKPYNLTVTTSLIYMENATINRTAIPYVTSSHVIITYAVSMYNDGTGKHSQICHYDLSNGGFSEPCNFDNSGNIPTNEIPVASALLHPGINMSSVPKSLMMYPNTSPSFNVTISTNPDSTEGTYWIILGGSLCGPGVLAKLVVLP